MAFMNMLAHLAPPDASALSGVPGQSILNWRFAGHLDGVGQFDERHNRWLYSIVDVIKLRIVMDLTTTGVRQAHAVAIASQIDQRVAELAGGAAPEKQVIVAWVEGDELTVRRGRGEVWLAGYGHCRPTIVVPIDNLTIEMFAQARKLEAIKAMRARINASKQAKRARR